MKCCSVCLKDNKCSSCLKCSCEEFKCKVHKCCNSCTFWVFERATTKEWCKSQCKFRKWPNKACERCFSVNLSPSAPPMTNVLSVVEGLPVGALLQKFWQVWAQKGSSPRVVSILKEGYNLPFQFKPTLTRVPLIRSGICQSPQEQLPVGGIAFPSSETSYRGSTGSVLSGVLQQTVHCPQTKSKMAANPRSQYPKQVPQGQNLQNGNPRIHLPVPSTGRMGQVARFQRRLLSHPYQSKLKEVSPVPLSEQNLPVSGSPVWPFHSSYGVYYSGQGGKTHGSGAEHPNAPVPR